MFKRMVTCDRGHKYDKRKHSSCPFCGVSIDIDLVKSHREEQNRIKTESPSIVQELPKIKTEEIVESVTVLQDYDEEETGTVLKSVSEEVDLVFDRGALIGWLVAVKGQNLYQSYPIYKVENYYGIDHNGRLAGTNDEDDLAAVQFSVDCTGDKWLLSAEGDIKSVKVNGEDKGTAELIDKDVIGLYNNYLQVQFFYGSYIQ